MTKDVQGKLAKLKDNLKALPGLAVAYSGGVDSSLLLAVAHQVLGDGVLAVTARSATYPDREAREAAELISRLGVKYRVIALDQFEITGFADNPYNRCYLCKQQLFKNIALVAGEYGITHIAEGSNRDDIDDYRPGMQAVREMKIISPLMEAGFNKVEIRLLAREMGLENWDKPQAACLASRIPFGEKINREKLAMVERAEDYLIEAGFRQVRVRMHGRLARIEADQAGRELLANPHLAAAVEETLKKIGFTYATLDLGGYRRGSFNPE